MTKRLNLENKKFGNLMVLKYIKGGRWLCKCDCGNICEKSTRTIRDGKYLSCGCLNPSHKNRKVDFSGVKYFNLEIIKQVEKPVNKIKQGRYWLCKCKCGNEKIISTSDIYKIKSCGCLNHEARIKNAKKGSLKIRKGIVAVENDFLRGYKRSVKDRKSMVDNKIEFLLTDEEAINLFHGECYYCGGFDTRKNSYLIEETYKMNGIDRVDNNKSYTIENTVSCCKKCNYAKRKMPQEEFYHWIKKVYQYSKKKGKIDE